MIDVVLAAPRGFCAGVRRAIDAVRDALAVHGAPIFVRRAIVHNLEVVRDLEADGAIFVEELDEVPPGGVVIFSAHGIAPAIAREARARGLVAYDAVCPLVSKVHREVERHQRDGRSIVMIGHAGHPEIAGTIGHVRAGTAFVVNSAAELADLPIPADAPAAYAIQTTFAVDEAESIVAALRARFANLIGPSSSDICYATTNRQTAVRALAAQVDAVIVAGESFSSNAARLAEVAAAACGSVQLIANADQIDWGKLSGASSIGITAAASTPECAVQAIVSALGRRYRLRVSEYEAMRETTVFKRLAIAS
ncbi:MAG: 4-hydroxy-3-methylbut-2-enyl diphosphate reductase [uncultured Sphingomonas sp.]|uniref:4-hydroxy-3-methylbut-2-enyl diphosphate reductase n=1 Tax=uncultured Sphingomonas sp. TaxID=158754 RepID=A0A6J4S7T2_9SPHN|nr:MAG: 4-hydroxy-3-methylbut-2-enyl diphosphate reductase [uncultured Sphingomonas sp.]